MSRVRVALVGAGLAGGMHAAEYSRAAGLLAAQGIELAPVVLADADLDRARSLARRTGFPEYTMDWRAVVDRPDVDLVDICLPDHLHADVAIAAAAAGKHLLCEKPLAPSPEIGRAMVDAVERAGVTAMVGLQYRRTPAAERIRQLVDTGRLGRVHTVRAFFARDLGVNPEVRKMWRFDPAFPGAGSIHALGPHVLDLLRFLAGDITGVVATVRSELAEGGAADTADVLLHFENGAHGVLQTSWIATGYKHRLDIELMGTEGTAKLSSDRLGEVLFADSGAPADGFRTMVSDATQPAGDVLGLTPGVAVGLDASLTVQLCDLVSAIVTETPVTPDFRDGLAVDQCLAAIERSSREGRWIAPAAVDRFPDPVGR